MIGCYDFCAHYDWTFAWFLRNGGPAALRRYWEEAIARDSQGHAGAMIAAEGFEGMARYWGHTLKEEAAGYASGIHEAAPGSGKRFFRIDMYECPSKGFLLRNGLQFSPDYCDHCMGWIGPMLEKAGYAADHEHDHQGHCWWEIRALGDPTPPTSADSQTDGGDVRARSDWDATGVDRYARSRKCAGGGGGAESKEGGSKE